MCKKRAINTPHPTTISATKRVWLDGADLNTFALNGAKAQTWARKLNTALTFTQDAPVNQPTKLENAVVWNDPANNQWLSAGENYLYIDSSHSGVSLFFLVKSDQVQRSLDTPKFIFDAGNYSTRGIGVAYASNAVWCYTPTAHGGAITEKRPLSAPTTDWVTVAIVIKFGDSQKLYVNNVLEAQASISLKRLTSSELSMTPTPQGDGGPVTIGSGAKKGQYSSRWFGGSIKSVVVVDEALSDREREWTHRYLTIMKTGSKHGQV